MALQAHIEYLRQVLARTEHERNSAWGDKDRLEKEKNAVVGERDRLAGEKNTTETLKNEMERERDQVKTERDQVKAERDKLEERLKEADAELKEVRQERDQFQGQLKVLQGQKQGEDSGIIATGGGQVDNNVQDGRWMGRMLHELDQRRRLLMDIAQKDETSELRVRRYVHYVGFAKADMLFWENMIETEARLEVRSRPLPNTHETAVAFTMRVPP